MGFWKRNHKAALASGHNWCKAVLPSVCMFLHTRWKWNNNKINLLKEKVLLASVVVQSRHRGSVVHTVGCHQQPFPLLCVLIIHILALFRDTTLAYRFLHVRSHLPPGHLKCKIDVWYPRKELSKRRSHATSPTSIKTNWYSLLRLVCKWVRSSTKWRRYFWTKHLL